MPLVVISLSQVMSKPARLFHFICMSVNPIKYRVRLFITVIIMNLSNSYVLTPLLFCLKRILSYTYRKQRVHPVLAALVFYCRQKSFDKHRSTSNGFRDIEAYFFSCFLFCLETTHSWLMFYETNSKYLTVVSAEVFDCYGCLF